MSHSAPRRLQRALTTGTLAISATLLAACGSATSGEPDKASPAAGPFEYTDHRGETVKLDQVPDSVVAQSSVAAALWDAGYKVDGVYGELGEVDGHLNYQAGSIDVDETTVLGKTYGDFNLEQFAALRPDLLIDFSMDGKTLWYVPEELKGQITELASTIGIKGQGIKNTDEAIESFVDLAADLGADTDSAELAAAKEDYEEALAEIKQVAAEKTDLDILLVSRTPELMYAAHPTNFPEIQTLEKLGLDFVEVNPDETYGGFFEELSWEQAGKYDADVIIVDARETDDVARQVDKLPVWQNLPAVKAGQVYEWKTAAPYSYAQYAPIFHDVATWLKDAEPVD